MTPKFDKILWLQGGVFVLGGMLAPLISALKVPLLSWQDWAAMIIGSLLGGCSACTAFTSTKYANSKGYKQRQAAAERIEHAKE